jgi:hypothetical protein
MSDSGAGRALRWLASLGLVVVASIAVATAPQEGTIADPFIRTGSEGEVVHARKLDVEVTDVRLAEQLDLVYDETQLDTGGVWVVVDLTVTSNIATIQLSYTELRLNGIAYRTRSLPNPGMDFISYGPGVPVSGSLAFELPTSALEAGNLDDARISFQSSISVQLDDVPEVIVDLTGLDVTRRAIIDEPVVGGVGR